MQITAPSLWSNKMLSSSFLTKVCWLQCSCNQTWLLASYWLDTCWTCPIVANPLLNPPTSSLPTELSSINPQTKVCARKGELHVLQHGSKQSGSLNSVLSGRVIDLSKPFILPPSEPPVEFLDPPEQVEVRVGKQARLHCEFRSSSRPVACCWIYNRDKVSF